jgi:hypothetical protein
MHDVYPELYYTSAAGRETIRWPTGSAYSVFSPNAKGGHGVVADLVVLDEAWTVTSDVLGGIVPALATRPLGQLLVITTMGRLDSYAWNGLRDLGRSSVEDPDSTLAYVEYSAEEEEDVFDRTKWSKWMPALGHTISEASIASDISLIEADPTRGRAEVVRAYGNLTVSSDVSLFPAGWVDDAWRPVIPPVDGFVIAVDVNRDPVGASIVTGHMVDGIVATQLVTWRDGSANWIAAEVEGLLRRYRVDGVVADLANGSPTKDYEPDLAAITTARGVPLIARNPGQIMADSGRFYAALRDKNVALSVNGRTGQPPECLAAAIRGAAKRQLGDGWLVSRSQMMIDASPLIATILAFGMTSQLAINPPLGFSIH